MSNWKKILKTVSKPMEWVVFAVLIFTFIVVLLPLLPTKNYLSIFIVPTGSMEPTIKAGSIAFVKPIHQEQVQKGQIITFLSPKNPDETIIHRVYEVKTIAGTTALTTKGDNNNVADNWIVSIPEIKGIYVNSVPYLGHPIALLRNKVGFAVMVGIPALIIALLQILRIKEGIEEEVQKRTKKELEKNRLLNHDLVNVILIGLVVSLLTAHYSIQLAKALFSSKVMINGISIKAANPAPNPTPTATPSVTPTPDLEPSPTATPSPTPSDDDNHRVSPGDIVINEIMWMGSSTSSADEWIELKNMRNFDIDLSNWKIDNAVSGHGHLEIPSRYFIPALGYFLIANYDENSSHSNLRSHVDLKSTSLNLNNNYLTNGQLKLWDKDGNIIDLTPYSESASWPAGNNSQDLHQSMERKNDPGDGNQTSNWKTCSNILCSTSAFWDTTGKDFGTPGLSNISASPSATLTLSPDQKTLSFQVIGITKYSKLNYQITYDSDTISDGIQGLVDLSGADTFSSDNLTLGTCSSGGTCVYYSNVKNIHLQVTLEGSGVGPDILEKLIP